MTRFARLSSTLAAAVLALGLAARPVVGQEAPRIAGQDRDAMSDHRDALPTALNGLSLDGIMPAPEPAGGDAAGSEAVTLNGLSLDGVLPAPEPGSGDPDGVSPQRAAPGQDRAAHAAPLPR